MKAWAAAALLLPSLAAAAAAPRTPLVLDTPRFTVTITVRCPEGEVECADVRYRGVNRRTGRALVLKGRTLNQRCANGVDPCRFLGWEFRNQGTVYVVGDDGTLSVRQGDRLLLSEPGTWR